MYKSFFILLGALPVFFTSSYSQIHLLSTSVKPDSNRKVTHRPVRPVAYMGLGVGLDYGGVGVKVEFLPVNFAGFFGGFGYNVEGIGYNLGFSFRMQPRKKFRPLTSIMYGYNSVLVVKDQYGITREKKVYYGLSAGAGFEVDINRKRTNKIGVQLLVPIRNSEFYKDVKDTRADYLPIAIGIGINFGA